MERDYLIKKIMVECPLCDKKHEIEERRRNSCITIKGESIEYEEFYYLCNNSDEDENEFITAKMSNDNLMKARNAYRLKKGY